MDDSGALHDDRAPVLIIEKMRGFTLMQRAKKTLVGSIVFVVVSALLAGGALALPDRARAAAPTTPPAPSASAQIADADGFPSVDWDYWESVNPDVVGWVSVEGTEINYPIVQAPAEDPTYYLEHDVYKNDNYAGCPYLDADCAATGLLTSPNAVVSGHNLGHGDTSMFAPFANFSDPAYAQTHATILIQTPDAKRALSVHAACVLSGTEPDKRTNFLDATDWKMWWKQCMDTSNVVLDASAPATGCAVSFVTCSYNYSDNERTIVYAG